MNDVIIISDLHLGSSVCQSKLINKFLSQIDNGEIKTETLILNGDVFDSWDFRRLCKSQWKILSKIRKLSKKVVVIWVQGNHDGPGEMISHLIGVDFVEEHILKSGDKNIMILHGDRFDNFISKHPKLTKFADKIYCFLQKIHLQWAIRIKRKSKIFIRCAEQIKAKAKEYANKNNCQTVCCGHVHIECEDQGEISYYNSGCWTEVPATYLTISNGDVKLHHFV